jgi:hypothetical protein
LPDPARTCPKEAAVKTYAIELQNVKAMSYAHGLIQARIDALVQPAAVKGEGAEPTTLSMSEATARVLLLLIKAQLAELDARKERSRR